MASINGTITLISLPAIFRGIQIDPLTSFQYLLWILFGYSVVTATMLVTFGRLSDMYGRVRLYNLGFAIFTVGSVLLFLTPNIHDAGALELIFFRILQGVGGAFLFANSAAILTDAFPYRERGKALGINQVAALAGSLLGLVLGGILAAIDWRFVFLVSVPVGVFGTAWSYLKLKELATIRKNQRLDILGNATFGVGLTVLLIAVTYGLIPYGNQLMGWSNPWVIAGLVAGAALLVAFPFVEARVQDPMFRLGFFKNRMFAAANFAGMLGSIGRGGVMILLIILLQGIWLPLHGYSYSSTPFWSGIFMIPMMAGFVVMGPLSGYLSDRYGARGFSTLGMVISAGSFLALAQLPYNFSYPVFGGILFVMGLGSGMFAAPNTASIMNSVPQEHRGVASGMRATLQNTGQTLSLALFFTIVIGGLANNLPGALASALQTAGASNLAPAFANISPTGALFAAFLGYNPMGAILAAPQLASVVQQLPQSVINNLEGQTFFPNAIAPAFMNALALSFYIGVALSLAAAVSSVLRGQKYIHEVDAGKATGVKVEVHLPMAPQGEQVSEKDSRPTLG
ncbi:MAG: MFS transporter [Nitrososphaerota archaeon]|nr:MFS transporter [Nitrososphaerota archaeon]MDG6959650.1 MFS transporter [Nitrososphaerota archaeon]MDG6965779.1 MFS transporter [Nitrososphaerota archaeon]MDG6968927.1 MFS transporter [Nitrososphaerota archaeon]MDG6973264.1 MFS transporter [Nitrososphaerota archaeon]